VKKGSFFSILLIVILASYISGCATHSIKNKIDMNDYSMSPWKEIYSDTIGDYKEIGKYTGIISIKNQRYSRIIITGACNDRSKDSIEILVPIGVISSARPIIHDVLFEQASPILDEVRINMFSIAGDKNPAPILFQEDWSGYPANLFLTEASAYGSHGERIIKIAYRNGPLDEDIVFLAADTKKLSSVCREKELSKSALYLLYPVAFAFDVITSPIQLTMAVLIFRSMDNQRKKN